MLEALGIDSKRLQEAQQDIVREDVILSRTQIFSLEKENKHVALVMITSVSFAGTNKIGIYSIYLEAKWGPLFWLEFGPCFEELTFKNRGHWGPRHT